ncbi:hypothetical protein FHG87_004687 [Trinorchestia longiramus]|nr:hypothetical protein FHG87_004687 [Trinorchestia longiramus]
MVTRLFSSKNSSSQSSHKNTSSNGPPPPIASQKPKSPFFSTIGKPPRKRPTNLPLSHSQCKPSVTQNNPLPHRSQYSSKTPPASTFRSPHSVHLKPNTSYGQASASGTGRHPLQQQAASPPFHLPSTYLSFADADPNYGCMDLVRARSDESLLWAAEEEASALVAELRASLNCNSVSSDNNLNSSSKIQAMGPAKDNSHKLNPYQYRPEQNDKRISNADEFSENGQHHVKVQNVSSPTDSTSSGEGNPFQRSFSVHKRNSEARLAAEKLNHSPPLRSFSFTDLQSAVELVPLKRPTGDHGARLPCSEDAVLGVSCSGSLSCCHAPPNALRHQFSEPPLKTFGGSWKSLLRVGGMSGRGPAKPPGSGVKKVAPPTVPGHHLQPSHLQQAPHSDPSTPTLTPTHGSTPTSGNLIIPSPSTNVPSVTPDTPTSSTSSGSGGSSNANSNYRHSGCSFHSSSTSSSSGVFTDQRASFSSSVSSSEDAVSTNSSNPPPSPCSPSSGALTSVQLPVQPLCPSPPSRIISGQAVQAYTITPASMSVAPVSNTPSFP